MEYRLFFGTLDTEKGFIFDAKFLFKMKTEMGVEPEFVMETVKDLFIKGYAQFKKNYIH